MIATRLREQGKERKKIGLLNNTIQTYKSEIISWAGTLEPSFPSNLIWCIQMHVAFIYHTAEREQRHRRKIFSKPRFSSALRIWPWKVPKSACFLSTILKMFSTSDKKLSKLQVQPLKLFSSQSLKLKIEHMCFSLFTRRQILKLKYSVWSSVFISKTGFLIFLQRVFLIFFLDNMKYNSINLLRHLEIEFPTYFNGLHLKISNYIGCQGITVAWIYC